MNFYLFIFFYFSIPFHNSSSIEVLVVHLDTRYTSRNRIKILKFIQLGKFIYEIRKEQKNPDLPTGIFGGYPADRKHFFT